MKRSKEAKLSDQFFCWLLRTVVLMIFAFVGLGVWLAIQGNPSTLSQATMLLVMGSLIAFLAQAFADARGAYSRVRLLNSIVYLYSLAWLPTIATFALWQLTQWEFKETAATLIIGGFFWLIGYSTRVHRRQQQGEHTA